MKKLLLINILGLLNLYLTIDASDTINNETNQNTPFYTYELQEIASALLDDDTLPLCYSSDYRENPNIFLKHILLKFKTPCINSAFDLNTAKLTILNEETLAHIDSCDEQYYSDMIQIIGSYYALNDQTPEKLKYSKLLLQSLVSGGNKFQKHFNEGLSTALISAKEDKITTPEELAILTTLEKQFNDHKDTIAIGSSL